MFVFPFYYLKLQYTADTADTAIIMEWNGMSYENWPVRHHCRTSAMLFILFGPHNLIEATCGWIFLSMMI